MGALESIVLLAGIGFLLLAAEVFVPGLVLGLLGAVCLVAGAVVAYGAYGPVTGSLVFIGMALTVGAGFVAWMFAFPSTPIGRRIMLDRAAPTGPATTRDTLLGKEGAAFTALRPAGTALIEGRKWDVVAESDFIEPGDPLIVVREEGMRILVRKKL